ARALIVGGFNNLYSERDLIIALAARYKIPTMYPGEGYTAAGGLMSYSSDRNSIRELGADYVGRILKGAKASDLPVRQPAKFNLVINLRTSKELGLKIPRLLLLRSDELIDVPANFTVESPWKLVPTITVVSAAGDPRLALVRDAVAFWNDTFAQLGTPFRLGP